MRNVDNAEKKKVTIYSVANEAGVSLATVSRVINDSSVVKEETRIKVQEAIEKLGYKPNAVAQGLALKKTTTIALVVPDGSFSQLDKIINGILDTAKIYKYNVTLHTSTEGVNEMDEIIDNVVKSRVDGLIIYNNSLSNEDLQTINNFQIPMVYLGNKQYGESICCVYVDYQEAVYNLVDKYLKKGIEDIVVVDDRKNPNSIAQIVNGATNCFKDHGKQFNGLIKIPNNYHSSYDFLIEYFATNKHQVVITHRDSQAIAVLNTCNENGIKIPEETELVCVRESRMTDMVRPRISSFIVPSYDSGALAMRIVTKMLNEEKLVEREFKLNYVFKQKGTTKL